MARDPLLLQFLLQYFQWQSVATLIIDSQGGDIKRLRHSDPSSDLRGRIGRLIYAWHVSFFNEDRVAIAIDPPPPFISGLRPTVRELRPRAEGGKLEVDPHFECYAGWEQNQLHALPLKVLLFTGSSGATDYLDEVESFLRHRFTGHGNGPIVARDSAENYEEMRLMALVPRGQRLDYTMIVQVDEFWQPKGKHPVKGESDSADFCDAYLNARTVDEDGAATPEDPFHVFQPAASTVEHDKTQLESPPLTTRDRRRYSFFRLQKLGYVKDVPRKENPDDDSKPIPDKNKLGMVPMMWDFGFLLCRRRAWQIAGKRKFEASDGQQRSVQEIYDWLEIESLPYPEPRRDELKKSNPNSLQQVRWFDFFQACRLVAQTQTRHGMATPVYAFDIDMCGTESLSCFIFEIMASELVEVVTKEIEAIRNDIAKNKQNLRGKHEKEVNVYFSLLRAEELKDAGRLIINLRNASDHLSHHLEGNFPAALRKRLENTKRSPSPSLQQALVDALNHLLQSGPLYDKARFKNVELSATTQRLLSENPQDADLIYLNRCLLEDAYPQIAGNLHIRRRRVHDALAFFPRPARRDDEIPFNLIDILQNPLCQEALMRALLLLFGITEPEQFHTSNFTLPERAAEPTAIAARHWYSTASRAMSKWDALNPTVPLRMPGNYSMRGDWFLTIANGSQSSQLAKSALDVLSSTRANIARMQHGMGLPTRTMQGLGHQRTRLYTVHWEIGTIIGEGYVESAPPPSSGGDASDDARHKRRVRYDEVRALGARDDNNEYKKKEANPAGDLHWIWRSRLHHYQRHSRIWSQWLFFFAQSWHRRRVVPDFEVMDGFELYVRVRNHSDNPKWGYWDKRTLDANEKDRKDRAERLDKARSDYSEAVRAGNAAEMTRLALEVQSREEDLKSPLAHYLLAHRFFHSALTVSATLVL